MKWAIERDLLIAQALAFVQSVSGKKEDARKPDAAPDIEAAPIDAIIDDAFKYGAIKGGSIKDDPIEDTIKIVARPASIGASFADECPERFSNRDTGQRREFPCAPGALSSRSRRILSRHFCQDSHHHGQRPLASSIA